MVTITNLAQASGPRCFVAEGTEYTLTKDDVVFIPAEMKHSLAARGAEDLVIVEIYTPAPAQFLPVESP